MATHSLALIGAGTISPMVRKVEYALALKQLEYDRDANNLALDRAKLLALNPLGQIPVLLDDDFVVAGSSIICAYLDNLSRPATLVPSTPEAEARCSYISRLADGPMWALVMQVWLERVVRPIEGVPVPAQSTLRDEVQASLEPYLAEVERHLARGTGFVVDDQLRVADLALGALTTTLDHAGAALPTWASQYRLLCEYSERLADAAAIAKVEKRIAATIAGHQKTPNR